VTFLRSKEAREYETKAKNIYDMVYETERLKIFFKATLSRCVGSREVAYIRSDTKWAVPESELVIVLGPKCEINRIQGSQRSLGQRPHPLLAHNADYKFYAEGERVA
jgi:fumarylacetoacetate (FAA) hydrolase family protein